MVKVQPLRVQLSIQTFIYKYKNLIFEWVLNTMIMLSEVQDISGIWKFWITNRRVNDSLRNKFVHKLISTMINQKIAGIFSQKIPLIIHRNIKECIDARFCHNIPNA